MKLGFVSDSLSRYPLAEILNSAARMGVHGIEVNTGGWSTAPHLNLQSMLNDALQRRDFSKQFSDRGLSIASLNANGNPVHPTDLKQGQCLKDTIRLAGEMGIKTVCTMSGLPAGSKTDAMPNWIVATWPPETQTMLKYQWDDVLLPFWTESVELAKSCGVEKIALELHGSQCVYNVPTLLRLREAVGPIVGANLDPSHLFWMGADPLAAVDALGEAVYHVHAKDTWLNSLTQATTSLLENDGQKGPRQRSWSYITLGYGHGEQWWREFVYRLLMVNYKGWLSIEHEDPMLNSLEGLEKSVALLKNVMGFQPADYVVQAI
jgi:sugar phosphate isomerase/epimerase